MTMMITITTILPSGLPARIERDLQLFQEAFAGETIWAIGSPLLWAMVLAAVGAAGSAWALLSLVRHDRAAGGAVNRHVMAALGLAAADRRFISRMARLAGLTQPAAVLISEGCFDFAARRLTPTSAQAARARLIRRKVFGPER